MFGGGQLPNQTRDTDGQYHVFDLVENAISEHLISRFRKLILKVDQKYNLKYNLKWFEMLYWSVLSLFKMDQKSIFEPKIIQNHEE